MIMMDTIFIFSSSAFRKYALVFMGGSLIAWVVFFSSVCSKGQCGAIQLLGAKLINRDMTVNERWNKIAIWIDLNYMNGGIKTNLIGTRSKLTNLGIIRSVMSRPLGSRRVLGLIHWQALKLWFKGARYRTRPEPPEVDVSQ